MVTMKEPVVSLYNDLLSQQSGFGEAGIKSVTKIGDCVAPGPIAMAVHDGHRYGMVFGESDT